MLCEFLLQPSLSFFSSHVPLWCFLWPAVFDLWKFKHSDFFFFCSFPEKNCLKSLKSKMHFSPSVFRIKFQIVFSKCYLKGYDTRFLSPCHLGTALILRISQNQVSIARFFNCLINKQIFQFNIVLWQFSFILFVFVLAFLFYGCFA